MTLEKDKKLDVNQCIKSSKMIYTIHLFMYIKFLIKK